MLHALFLCFTSQLKNLLRNPNPGKASKPPASSFAALGMSKQLRRVFELIDSNGDGKLSPFEVKQLLLRLGYESTDAANEAHVMVKVLDFDGDGFVDLDEYMRVLVVDEYDDDGDYVEAFRVFDADENGLISAKELQRVLRKLGCCGSKCCSLKECKKMIKGVDRDGDGFVSLEEFKLMMKGGGV